VADPPPRPPTLVRRLFNKPAASIPESGEAASTTAGGLGMVPTKTVLGIEVKA
jgi:hypothetical protein